MKISHALLPLAMLTAAGSANAVNLVTNGSFESATLGVDNKQGFQGNVTGWTGGGGLSYIDGPGTADNGVYLSVYGPFPTTSPDGGNFVEIDADRNFGQAIQQTISGLTVGQSYTVSFYQAAGQQQGFQGATTEAWDVSLGEETHQSSTFSLPQGGVGPWQAQSLHFTAAGVSAVLSFFATGTPQGQPPIAFLDGVSLTADVPEPATWALMLGGFGIVGAALRRRATTVVAA
jgi:hypothetical protein